MAILTKEKADGYHLAGCSSTSLIRIPQFRTVPYKLEDFVPIMHFGAPPSGLVVRADSPWKTLKEFVEYAKKNPGKVTYSSMGIGSPMHLAMEYIAKQEGIQWTHVPFPGSGPAFLALLGGHVTAESGSSESFPHVREGTIRLLATHHENMEGRPLPFLSIFRVKPPLSLRVSMGTRWPGRAVQVLPWELQPLVLSLRELLPTSG